MAWTYAMKHPDRTDRLIVLNLPHPKGLSRELANNPKQQKNSQYARNFQKEGAEKLLSPELLSLWVKETEARKHYVEAFKRSSMEGMLNYYRANYPKEPYRDEKAFPPVKCPVCSPWGAEQLAPSDSCETQSETPTSARASTRRRLRPLSRRPRIRR